MPDYTSKEEFESFVEIIVELESVVYV